MTVQELIDELSNIEDKSVKVSIYANPVGDTQEVSCIEVSDKSIIIDA